MGFAIFGIAGWALIALAIVLTIGSIQRTSRGGKPIVAGGLIGVLVILGIVLNIIGNGLISIAQNERGLVRNLFTGVRLPTLEPGVHFVTPFVESVKRYSTGQDTYTMSKSTSEGEVKGDDSVTARTSDGQEVFIDASITFRPDGSKLLDLFTRFPQDDWKDVLVRPQARSIIYNRVAVYKVEEVYSTKREALQKQIEDDMRAVLARNGLVLESFLMRNVTFNAEYAKSIEDKQIAQQNAERARFVVDQERQEAERVRVAAQGRADAAVTAAKAEAEAQVIRAKAEAEALSLVAAQLKDNPNLLTFRYIEKLSPGVQTIFLPANQPFLLDPKTFVGPQPQPTPAAQQPQQP